MSKRRELSFASLDEVMPEVDRLLQGYKTVGNWSLGQICNHLVLGIHASVEQQPPALPWIVRKTVARVILKRVLSTGRMRENVQIPDEFRPKSGLDDRAEAEALRAAIPLFLAANFTPADHPFFGPLTFEQWNQLHRIHCAHHLSFVIPT